MAGIRNGLGAVIVVWSIGAWGAQAMAQETSTPPQEEKTYHPEDFFPNLLMELQMTSGCLGVESAKTASGKDVVFSWFKDKESLLGWYHGELHQKIMGKVFPGRVFRTPLESVPDDSGPILVVASITFDPEAKLGGRLPIGQIAIELYTPLSGGVALNGRFAPSTLTVPNLLDYSGDASKEK
jgi:hypothetical protein